jgi:DNA polymerase-1
MVETREKLYLIDGPNMAFRAFFAIGGMTNSAGLPTNALFGFTNMLVKLMREERPDYLAVVWDPKGGSFREEIFPDYKGTRPDMPDALREQLPHFERVADAFAVPFLCIPGFEADDVLGTLAQRYGSELDVVLVSSDKDLMQLVTDHVTMLDTMKDRRIGVAEVIDKFGCPPAQVPHALAIWGDSSDNIPGVKGIGEKGVKKLLGQWRDLDDIYAHIDDVTPPGVRTKLVDSRDNAYLSLDLATIRTDVDVDVELDQLSLTLPPPVEGARSLFSELGFRSLLREFGGSMKAIDRDAYRLVTGADELAALCSALGGAQRFALDTETTSLDPMRADLVGLSFCAHDTEAWYVPVAHSPLVAPEQLSWSTVREALASLLEDPAKGKTGQNLKYDLKVLRRHGVNLQGIDSDTLIADYLLEPDRRTRNLDDLALAHLEHKMLTFSETVGDGNDFASVPLEAARDYAAEDAHVAWLLDQRMTPLLTERGLDRLYRELEVPLIPVLNRMEEHGIGIDSAHLAGLSAELEQRIAEAERRCHELAGRTFVISSVPQLREVLFEDLGLPVIRKTKTGPSTAESVLSELALQHELPQAILDYRGLLKLKNTYVEPLPAMIHPDTGRLHTHYSQTTAATGRLASTDPNLQNIPVRTAEGRRIRQAFVAPEGRVFLSADYSQVELRVLAHLCGGRGGFARAFADGTDVHAETAAALFDVPPGLVDREMRTIAKAVNFGIIYGQTAFGLAQTLRISRTDAGAYIARFKERFPEVEEYRQSTLEAARSSGHVETLLGRLRPVPDLRSGNFVQRSAAERIAVNTPVQGTAADLIKKAMIAVDRRLADEQPGQYLLLQVHDELLLEVDEDRVDAVAELVRHEMVSAIELAVPLVVDVGTGRNWDEAH